MAGFEANLTMTLIPCAAVVFQHLWGFRVQCLPAWGQYVTLQPSSMSCPSFWCVSLFTYAGLCTLQWHVPDLLPLMATLLPPYHTLCRTKNGMPSNMGQLFGWLPMKRALRAGGIAICRTWPWKCGNGEQFLMKKGLSVSKAKDRLKQPESLWVTALPRSIATCHLAIHQSSSRHGDKLVID